MSDRVSGAIVFVIFIICIGLAISGGILEFEPASSISPSVVNGIAIVAVALAGIFFCSSWWSDRRVEKIMNENQNLLKEIKKKLDHGIIITQNMTAVIKDEKPKKMEEIYLIRGAIGGLWLGVIGGLLSGYMISILEYDARVSSTPFPTNSLVLFFMILAAVVIMTLLASKKLDKLESSDNSEITFRN